MKKIFSAFLLMTMMVASVGSFVSCSDIEESIAAVDEATKNNADAVEALKSEVAALKTALATAQADAAAAKTEANAAKQAAATAKAEAIAAALAEIEKVNGDVDAMQAVIDSINAALTGKADKATVELLQATLDEYKALNDAAVAENAAAIAALEEALAALGENIDPEQFAEVVEKMTAIDEALIAFQSRIQSLAYVPQSSDEMANIYTVGKETTDYIVKAAYQVSPAKAAAELKPEDIKAKGLAVKAEAPAEFETKVLSIDETTGVVEVLVYIPEEAVEEEDTQVVLALAIENENGVEITSSYEKFPINPVTLSEYITIKDFNVTKNAANKVTAMSYTYKMPYDTPAADSKVDMIDVEFVVNVPGMFEDTPLAEALEYLGLENVTVERNPANRFGKEYIVVTNNSLYDNNATPTDATTDDLKVLKDTQSADKKDVTVEFSEDYAKVADATKLINKNVVVTLKEGFFTIAGDKLAATTITYTVVGKENKVAIEIEDVDSPWIPVATFIDVAYDGIAQKNFPAQTVAIVDADGKKVKGSDNNDVTATITTTSHDDLTVEFSSNFVWPEETTTYTVAGEFNGDLDEATKTQTVYTYEFTVTLDGRPENVEYEYAPATLPTLPLTPMPYPNDESKLEGKHEVNDLASKVEVGAIVTAITSEYDSYYEEGALAALIGATSPDSDENLEDATWKVYAFNVEKDEVGNEITLESVTPTSAPTTTVKGVYFDYVAATKTTPENSKFVFPYSVKNYKAIKGKALQLQTEITVNGVKYEIAVNVQASDWTGAPTTTATIERTLLSSEFQGAKQFTYSSTNIIRYMTGVDVNSDNLDDNDGSAVKTFSDGVYKVDANENKIVDWYTTYITPSKIGTGYVYPSTTFYFKDYITIKNTDPAKKYYLRWSVAPVSGVHYETVSGQKVDRSTKVDGFPTFSGQDGATTFSNIPSFVFNTACNTAGFTGNINNAGAAGYHGVEYTVANLNSWTLNWGATKVTSCKVKFELVDVTEEPTIEGVATPNKNNPAHYPNCGYVEVEFKTPATIKSVDATDIEVKWNETAGVGTIATNPYKPATNVAAALTVTDMFDVTVNNKGCDATLSNFWYDFEHKESVTDNYNTAAASESLAPVYVSGSTADYFKVYTQTINVVPFDHDGYQATGDALITCNGEAYATATANVVTGTYFTFNTLTGDLRYTGTSAPTEDLTFKVRVEVKHMNDNGTPIYKDVNIVVKK